MEIWKDIKDYEGLYQVSNYGRVRSLNYNRTGKTKLLNQNESSNGYLKVDLCKNGKRKQYLVHRLVASAFLDNPENKPEVNHKIDTDEGKQLNIVFFNEDGSINEEKTTIEWCDSKYNINYGSHNERSALKRKNGKLAKPVLQFSKMGLFIREWPSVMECERNGFNGGSVAACCRGKLKTHQGYIWRYK